MDYFELDCKHSISSIASNRDCRLLAVGGRESINQSIYLVLNLVEVNYEEKKMVVKSHLRNVKGSPK